MLQLIRRCPEYADGYKAYCQELFDHNIVFFRPSNPKYRMEKVLLNINEKNAAPIHVCEKLGGELWDTIERCNEPEGRHIVRRYWIKL